MKPVLVSLYLFVFVAPVTWPSAEYGPPEVTDSVRPLMSMLAGPLYLAATQDSSHKRDGVGVAGDIEMASGSAPDIDAYLSFHGEAKRRASGSLMLWPALRPILE